MNTGGHSFFFARGFALIANSQQESAIAQNPENSRIAKSSKGKQHIYGYPKEGKGEGSVAG